jgi:hypothetical protein
MKRLVPIAGWIFFSLAPAATCDEALQSAGMCTASVAENETAAPSADAVNEGNGDSNTRPILPIAPAK